jgi:hypothetical protein
MKERNLLYVIKEEKFIGEKNRSGLFGRAGYIYYDSLA